MRDLHVWMTTDGDEVRRSGDDLIEGPLRAALRDRSWGRLVAALETDLDDSLDLATHDDRVFDAVVVDRDDTGLREVVLRDVTRYAGPLRELAMVTQALNDRSHDLEAMERLANVLSATTDIQRVAEQACEAVRDYLDAEAVIVRFDGVPGDNAAGLGVLPPEEPAGEAALATPHLRLGTVRWWGGLVITPQRRRLISLMASRAAVVAETAMLFGAARDQATRDHLTGLLNRGGAIDQLDGLRAPAMLITIDLDHFKRVNDTFGHATGDRVLQEVGDVLTAICRPGDIVARWGGEEFLLAWPRVRDTEAALERLRVLVLRVPEQVQAGDEGVTISAGAALLDDEGWEIAVERSDRALYAAKAAGRNRLEVYAGS